MGENLGEAILELRTDDRKLREGIDRSERGARSMDKQFKRSSRGVRRSFDRTGDSAQQFGRKVDRVRGSFGGLKSAIAGLGLGLLARNLAQAGLEMDRIQRAMRATAETSRDAQDEFAFVRKEVQRLGLDLPTAAKQFVQLKAAAKGTALEGVEVRRIFSSVGEASLALGLTADQTSGALIALQQIISKGNVSAEELRQQLGERLPGAFRIAADSIGVTTAELNKMLEQGELTAEELLPSLATALTDRFGKAAEEAGDSAQAAFGRFNTEVFELRAELGRELLPKLTEMTTILREDLNDPQIIEGLKDITGAFATMVTWVVKLGSGFANVVTEMKEGFARMQGFMGGVADMQERIVELNEQIARVEPRIGRGRGGQAARQELQRLTEERDRLQQRLNTINSVTSRAGPQGLPTAGPGFGSAINDPAVAGGGGPGAGGVGGAAGGAAGTPRVPGTGLEDLPADHPLVVQAKAVQAEIERQQARHVDRMITLTHDKVDSQTKVEKSGADALTEISGGAFSQLASIAQTESKTLFETLKGVKTAEAIINTHAAVNQALAAYPPPLSFAMAAAQAARGFASVASIKGQTFGGSGGGGGGRGGARGNGVSVGRVGTNGPFGQTDSQQALPRQDVTISVSGQDDAKISKRQLRRLVEQIQEELGDDATLGTLRIA